MRARRSRNCSAATGDRPARGGRLRCLDRRRFASSKLPWTIAAIATIGRSDPRRVDAEATGRAPIRLSRAARRRAHRSRPKKAPSSRPMAFSWRLWATTRAVRCASTSSRSGRPGSARSLGKTEGASLPFWSPDSRQIGFFAQGSSRRSTYSPADREPSRRREAQEAARGAGTA